MRSSYHRFWAKTASPEAGPECHLLPYHNLDVAAVAQVVLQEEDLFRARLSALLGEEEAHLVRLVRALVALHDIGKFSERFQSLSLETARRLGAPQTDRPYTVRHDTLGQVAWTSFLYPGLWEEGILGLSDLHDSRFDWGDYLEPMVKPVMGHHGRPPDPTQRQEARGQFGDESREAALRYAREVIGFLAPTPLLTAWDPARIDSARKGSWMLAGLVVLADWIGSNAHFFDRQEAPMPLETYWKSRALPAARSAVQETGLLAPPASADTGLETLFPEYVPTPMQQYASETPLGEGPQLFILEDATGSGKTESALTLAHRLMAEGRAEGLYVGLPTMATANAMYERLAEAYQRLFDEPGRASLALAHSARDFSTPFRESIGLEAPGAGPSETYSAEQDDRTASAQCAAWLADQRKKALLSHVGVGTVDQALLGVLPSAHQSLRLLGLGRSVLIVDEVHAYDSYMQRLLRQLLTFQAAQGGSAILLSATLPRQMRQELAGAFRKGRGEGDAELSGEGYPLATRVGADVEEVPVNKRDWCREGARIREGYERNVRVEFHRRRQEAVDALVEKARRGKCACWIRNTVGDARGAYQALREAFAESEGLGPEQVGLFHARYALADRQSIEETVLERYGKESGPEERQGQVLIATQVVEQSLDLDFDYMISDLAPIDLLIQRAGRMHRHRRDEAGRRLEEGAGERGQALFGVLGPPATAEPEASWYSGLLPRAAYVYPDVGRLWLTARALETLGRIRVPEEARTLIERVYRLGAREEVPEVLREVAREAIEERRVAGSIAGGNVLQLEGGYGSDRDMGRWTGDEDAPTRLGPPTTTVRLGWVDGDRIRPWAEGGQGAWHRSELSVRASKIDGPPQRPERRRQMVARAEEGMPDEGRWSTLLCLEKEGDVWAARAQNNDGNPVEVTYSKTLGLKVKDPH